MRIYLLILIAALAQAQDFSEVEIRTIAQKLKFAEAPLWSVEPPALYFADVPVNEIWQVVPNQKGGVWKEQSAGATGLGMDTRGRLYICETRNRKVTRFDGKKSEVLAEMFEGKPLNSPDDIIVRRDGHVYFTDPAFGTANRNKQLDFYGIFHITPKGELEALARWKTRPGGLDLSPDGKRLYVSDADARKVVIFELDRNGKATGPERIFVSQMKGVPAGIAVDEKENVYVASGSVQIYSSAGKLIRDIPLREPASNLAFGGMQQEVLFVTARDSVYAMVVPFKGALQHAKEK